MERKGEREGERVGEREGERKGERIVGNDRKMLWAGVYARHEVVSYCSCSHVCSVWGEADR